MRRERALKEIATGGGRRRESASLVQQKRRSPPKRVVSRVSESMDSSGSRLAGRSFNRPPAHPVKARKRAGDANEIACSRALVCPIKIHTSANVYYAVTIPALLLGRSYRLHNAPSIRVDERATLRASAHP